MFNADLLDEPPELLGLHGLAAHHASVLGEGQVASEEGGIDMAIDGGNLRVAVEDGIESLHVIDVTVHLLRDITLCG